MRAKHAELVNAGEIEAVTVQCHPLALAFSNAAPETSLGAKFSMPHAVAAALVLGEAGAAAFGAQVLADQNITALRMRVEMVHWVASLLPPNDRPARIVVAMKNGNKFSAECLSAQGGPDRPLPEDIWREKMQSLAAPVYPLIVGVFEEIVLGDANRLDQRWADTVREITRQP